MCPTVLFRIFKPVPPQKEIMVNSMIRIFEDDNIMSENIKSSEISQISQISHIFMDIFQNLSEMGNCPFQDE
jgi:hypothetical protein